MDLREAWATLGFDPDEIVSRIRAGRTPRERLEVAERAAEEAKRVCAKVSAAHHPDRNQGDAGASARFRRTQNALQVISEETAKMAARVRELESRLESPKVVIEIGGSSDS